MTADNLYLALVATAFLIFGFGLFGVSIYVGLGDRKPAPQAKAARPTQWTEDRKTA